MISKIEDSFECTCGDNLCQGYLGFHRIQDPSLYDLYAKKLLIRGWAGSYTQEEEEYRRKAKPPSEAMKERGRVLSARQKTLSHLTLRRHEEV